ncbi:uncharacterized protein C8R40DRAFT_1073938 [Lentinula edodes]|uniref:uncharacterized protein n=1 Tax=Lentinula edodes TaxID=5353 RepID=UPI001E8CA34E|nr:uncharacterized protein C8R40DRAFT_1073938 [Lentinula edodes]KAH7869619.1 hypothetical protein C8R40DRAFT_1073938 [Lentinula edodes]
MPAHLRESLKIAIQACLSDTSAQFKSQEPSSSVETASFSSLHFTNQTRYLTHGYDTPKDIHPLYLINAEGGRMNHSQLLCYPSEDIQKLSGPYADLKQSLEGVLRWVVEKVLLIHPHVFQELVASVDVLPLQDTSPVSPFTSIMFNINVGTLAHRNQNDKSACICITVGNPKGGELAFGTRGSIVVHGDKTGVLYQKDGFGCTHETHETLTEKEASYLLRIADAQQTLCATEQAALDQKIQITKLILELHLCRQNKLCLENSKARRTALNMQEILNDYGKSGIQGLYSLDGSSHQPKTYPATAPSSPPSMRLDIGDDSNSDSNMGSEAYRGDDCDMEEPWEENTETTSTKEGKDQNTEILYLDQGPECSNMEVLQEGLYWIERRNLCYLGKVWSGARRELNGDEEVGEASQPLKVKDEKLLLSSPLLLSLCLRFLQLWFLLPLDILPLFLPWVIKCLFHQRPPFPKLFEENNQIL